MKEIRYRSIALPFILLLAVMTIGCGDKEYDRDKGPSDIRIENMSSETYDSIIVNTSGGENSYGSLDTGMESEYKRFEIAYPEADISLYVGSVKYSYGPINYTYLAWLGKGKFTYQVDLADTVTHTLSIHVIADAPLD